MLHRLATLGAALYRALAPLDPAEPEVAAAIQHALAELPPEPELDGLLAARARIWDRLASRGDSSPRDGAHPRGGA